MKNGRYINQLSFILSMNLNLEEYNPWTKNLNYGIDRLFNYPEMVRAMRRKEIQVLSGIRRCGKTTLLRQCIRHLLDQGVLSKHILFIPCDEPLLKLKTYEDVHKIIEEFSINKKRIYVFLDEVQVINGWEKYVKGRYDAEAPVKFFVSGSSASFFRKDVASYLTGRHFFHKITTCNYEEYMRISPKGSLGDYLEWGGFPEVILEQDVRQKKLILQTYLETIIQRDIIDRYNLRNRKQIEDFYKSILSVVGGKAVVKKLALQFHSTERSIVRLILAGLDSFLLEDVTFFSHSLRKNRFQPSKIYPCDIGFTRLLTGRFERGRSAEWAVLKKISPAQYWTNEGHEVDFVTRDLALQVTYTHEVSSREFDALVAFRKIFRISGVVLAISKTEKTESIEEFLTKNWA